MRSVCIRVSQQLPLALLILFTLIVAGCHGEHQPIHHSRFLAFGTLVDLDIVGADRETAERASAAIQADFNDMHQAWHAWDPGPLKRVNLLIQKGEQFAIPPSVQPLIEQSSRLSAQSNHLFNPAIGHLIDLWGFQKSPEQWEPPPQEAIDKLLTANPRMSDLQLDDILLQSSNPSVKLDFGAFGKGYGIDLAIEHLRELGIHSAILNSGGDLRAIGNRDGRPWRIAIRRPSGHGVFAMVEVDGDESVFTSGDYERNFMYEGRLYHHIIDPRTGYPATKSHSVTVIHQDAATADAAATALFIAGPDEWHEIAQAMGIKFVLLVGSDDRIHMNPAMQKRVILVDENHQEIVVSKPL
ncbi:thiamine biosynthesis protein ApbE [bacterium endosymbiont of Escarpia laminata]|nr:MAG: thiamine biosynthesis protein ApbE [bacterium endosymbiont of Escarpia laminata]